MDPFPAPKPSRRRAGPWRAALGLGPVLAALAGFGLSPCVAQSGLQHEYEVKAGELYYLISYTDWPADSLPPDAPTITVGLLGAVPFADGIKAVLERKIVQGRRLLVKRLASPQAAAQCQVVFIGASERSRLPAIFEALKARPVLTVGEVDGFVQRGGVVNLLAGPDNTVVMQVNRAVAQHARLTLSSQFLKLKLVKLFPR